MPRNVFLLALLACVGVAAGCTENLDGGAACPSLCPEERPELREIIVDPFIPTDSEPAALDTSVSGFPVPGAELYLLAARRGDTLDTRAILRFDTLLNKYRAPNRSTADSLITSIKRAWLMLGVAGRKVSAPVTISVYNVGGAADDTSTADLAAQFAGGNLLGSRTFTVAELTDSALFRDTLNVPLDTAAVRAAVVGGTRFRVGVQVTSTESAQLRFYSRDWGTARGPALRYDPAPAGMDSSALLVSTATSSRTPADIDLRRTELADFMIVVAAPAAPPADVLAVGGIPGRRTYLRFALPDSIVENATVIRATLFLYQRGDVPIDPSDTLYVVPHFGVAGTAVTDIQRAASLIGSAVADSIRVVAGETGVRAIELAPAIRVWRAQNRSEIPRAVVLRANNEGALPVQARFYSTQAAADSLRPRLRITYTPRIEFGLP